MRNWWEGQNPTEEVLFPTTGTRSECDGRRQTDD
jgi:hypothetical protein